MGYSKRACAVCKHQRRKCSPDCVVVRYYDIDNLDKFFNGLHCELRDGAAETMRFEAEMRHIDPVLGNFRIILDLAAQIDAVEREINKIEAARREIEACHQEIMFYQRLEHETRMQIAVQQQQLQQEVEKRSPS